MIEQLGDVIAEEYGVSAGTIDVLTDEELDALEAEAAAEDADAIVGGDRRG
jgi:hypothetical protein